MKVLVFTTLYPNNVWPNHGVFIRERMIHFAKLEGCSVKVVAPVPYFPAFKGNWRWSFSQVAPMEVRDGIEVYHPRYYMIPKFGMTLYGWLMFLSTLHTVKTMQKAFDFDIIDAHFVYPDGFAGVLLGKYFNKPVIVSARGSDINLYSTLPIIRRMLCYTLSRAKRVIAVSQALKTSIATFGVSGDKVAVVPNGVDVKKFYPLAKEAARSELNLARNRIILSAGNLTVNKGFDLLIRAFSRLANDASGVDPFLVIVGEGAMRAQLENLINSLGIRDRAKLVGAVPHEQMHLWYSAADLFCLASRREGWPNVVLESFACGTPVVATNVGGIPEIITADYLGVVVERDELALADAIESALKKRWNSNAITRYAKNQSWARVSLALSDLFQSVVDKNHATRRQSLRETA
jgi:glycosyltransferase involved in cell wall biosynthesis